MPDESTPPAPSLAETVIDELESDPALVARLKRVLGHEEMQLQILDLRTESRTKLHKLQQGQEALQSDVAELKQGQAKLQQGQEALQSDVAELKQGQAKLETGQAKLEAGHAKLEANQNQMQAQIDNLRGSDYEVKAAKQLSSLVYPHGLARTKVLRSNHEDSEALSEMLDDAIDENRASPEEISAVRLADIIAQSRYSHHGIWGYALCEVSITLDENDLSRAISRAQILARISGKPVTPVIIGSSISDQLSQQAEAAGAAVAILNY